MQRPMPGDAATLIFAGGLILVGTLTLGPVAGAIASGVGTDLLAGVTERGLIRLRNRWFNDPTTISDELRAVWERSALRAMKNLEDQWWATPRGRQQRQDASQREAVQGLFDILQRDARSVTAAGRFYQSVEAAGSNNNMWVDRETALQAISSALDPYLYGHDEQLVAFVQKNITPEFQGAFATELQAATPEGTRAWRAYQLVVAQGLQESIQDVQATQQLGLVELQRLSELLEKVQALIERIHSSSSELRNEMGFDGLSLLVNQARDEVTNSVAEQFALNRDEVREAFERISDLTSDAEHRIRERVDALRPDDVERLRELSRLTLEISAEFSKFRAGNTEVHIRRTCGQALSRMAHVGSLVVVGEPGAGKSGVLHELVQELTVSERDVVFLSADSIAAESLGEMRSELNLSRTLAEVLREWPGTEPAFLVVDALDAARSYGSAQTVRRLIGSIAQSGSRWNVIASIRKFDLRNDPELRTRFAGDPDDTFVDPEFAGVRHLNVARLNDEELAQVSEQSPSMRELLTHPSPQFLDLLRIPFNLRLAGDLIRTGAEPGDISGIWTQERLLDQYWLRRIQIQDGRRLARESLLRRVVESMVEHRQLRVATHSVVTESTGSALDELLSAHVLSEWQHNPTSIPESEFLSFAHHVLFDYAVARFYLAHRRGDDMTRLLSNQKDLVIALRPSLTFFFSVCGAWMAPGLLTGMKSLD